MNNLYLASLGKSTKTPSLALEAVSDAQWPGLAAAPAPLSLASLSGLNGLSRSALGGSLMDTLLKSRRPSQAENVFMGSFQAKATARQPGVPLSSLLSAPFPPLDLSSQRSEAASAISLALAPENVRPAGGDLDALNRQIREETRTSLTMPPKMSRTASLALLRNSLQTRRAERLAEALKLQREEEEVARALALSTQFESPVRKRSFNLASLSPAPTCEASLAPPAMKKARREEPLLCAPINTQQSFRPLQTEQQLPKQLAASSPTTTPSATGPSTSKAKLLSMACDEESLTPYQCLARKQIEIFAAEKKDVEAKGRNRSIVTGQVGIRCIHCAHLPARERSKGSTIYPSKLEGIYQAAQNMANSHISKYCQSIPTETREKLLAQGNKKSSAGGGRDYWSTGAKILGVGENEHGLCFLPEESD